MPAVASPLAARLKKAKEPITVPAPSLALVEPAVAKQKTPKKIKQKPTPPKPAIVIGGCRVPKSRQSRNTDPAIPENEQDIVAWLVAFTMQRFPRKDIHALPEKTDQKPPMLNKTNAKKATWCKERLIEQGLMLDKSRRSAEFFFCTYSALQWIKRALKTRGQAMSETLLPAYVAAFYEAYSKTDNPTYLEVNNEQETSDREHS